MLLPNPYHHTNVTALLLMPLLKALPSSQCYWSNQCLLTNITAQTNAFLPMTLPKPMPSYQCHCSKTNALLPMSLTNYNDPLSILLSKPCPHTNATAQTMPSYQCHCLNLCPLTVWTEFKNFLGHCFSTWRKSRKPVLSHKSYVKRFNAQISTTY